MSENTMQQCGEAVSVSHCRKVEKRNITFTLETFRLKSKWKEEKKFFARSDLLNMRVYVPQMFLNKHQEQWPCLRPPKVPHYTFCNVCNYNVDISHLAAAGEV